MHRPSGCAKIGLVERRRVLTNPGTGAEWATESDGTTVTVTSRTGSREKVTTRTEADAKAAVAYSVKEEWARLKKGFVLADPFAKPGAPRMHRYLCRDYTGALPMADVDGLFLVSLHDGTDRMLLLDAQAESQGGLDIPPDHLVWKAIAIPATGSVLLLIDHQVYEWALADGTLRPLTKGNRRPASFLSVAGSLAAWYDEPDVVVRDLVTGNDVFRRPVQPQLYHGHTPVMKGALTTSGVLAVCHQAGSVELLDLSTGGQPAEEWHAAFEMFEKLEATPDGRWLVAKERYGAYGLYCLDLASMVPRSPWVELLDPRGAFALEPTSRRLALVRNLRVHILDMDSLEEHLSFPLEHVVRNCAVEWIGNDTLGVRTDYGCASLYAVGPPDQR